jgi:hypothetical protein
MWTKSDNGQEVTFLEAQQYCENLRLGGYSDWRLPRIQELEKLYDPKSGGPYNIRDPFKLTGFAVWGSTNEGKKGSDSAWFFNFVVGKRVSYPIGFSLYYRALCVRGSGEK